MPKFVKSLPALASDATAGLFTCTWHGGMDAQWATLDGELDASTAPLLERALRGAESNTQLIVVDLRNVSFMDCAGLRAILQSSERQRESGGRMVIVRGRRAVDMVFTMTRTAGVVEIVDLPSGAPSIGETESYLACTNCGAVWLTPAVHRMWKSGKKCLTCAGELEVIQGAPPVAQTASPRFGSRDGA